MGLSTFLGGFKKDGDWIWTDGSPFNWTNWSTGKPDNVPDKDCLEMIEIKGTWTNTFCDNGRPKRFICSMDLGKKVSPLKSTSDRA